MARKILIIKNITTEGPGLLAKLLEERSLAYTLIDLHKEELLPTTESLTDYGAVIVLGGPDSANDTTEKMTAELAFVKQVMQRHLPYLGICLGLQVGVKACGGKVAKSPIKEIGWRDMKGQPFIVSSRMADPIVEHLPHEFRVFQLHGETVALTPEMHLVASSTPVQNQLVKIGERAYGLQFHCELTADMLDSWLKLDPDLLQLNSDDIRAEFAHIKTEYTTTGRTLFQNFLKIAGY